MRKSNIEIITISIFRISVFCFSFRFRDSFWGWLWPFLSKNNCFGSPNRLHTTSKHRMEYQRSRFHETSEFQICRYRHLEYFISFTARHLVVLCLWLVSDQFLKVLGASELSLDENGKPFSIGNWYFEYLHKIRSCSVVDAIETRGKVCYCLCLQSLLFWSISERVSRT